MADEDDPEDDDERGQPAGGNDAGKDKKKLILVIAVVVLLVVGGIAGAYFTGLLEPVIEMLTAQMEGDTTAEGEESNTAVYYEIPELLVDLNSTGSVNHYLKIRLSIEIGSALDIPKVEQAMPRVINSFQIYLRELRPDDLQGSAGIYRLSEELLMRVSTAVAPVKVNSVLLQEMLVQ